MANVAVYMAGGYQPESCQSTQAKMIIIQVAALRWVIILTLTILKVCPVAAAQLAMF